MNNEIDLSKYNVRTDLAIESLDNIKDKIKINEKKIYDIKITKTYINEENSKLINKKVGNYITIEFNDVTDFENRERLKNVFSNELKDMLNDLNIKEDDSCLLIGLGNSKSTPDSLGPLTINNILVTAHLFLLENVNGFRKVYAINPGVMGETGIESSDIIMSIVDKIKPQFLIVIDSLASSSIDKVNKTIQMTDTGIHPGSGIGNSRKEINNELLKIPVIAIGIPTVVDAPVIVSDTINYMYKHYAFNKDFLKKPISKLVSGNVNYLKKNIDISKEDKKNLFGIIGLLSDEEMKKLMYEVLTPIGYNLMVTPKEIDFVISKLSNVISEGINKSLHKRFDS